MTRVEYLRNYCKLMDIPISKVENDLGYGNGYFNPKKLKKIPIDKAVDIAEYLQIDVFELLDDEDAKRLMSINAPLADKYPGLTPVTTKTFPLLGEVSCGEPIIANNQYEVLSDGRALNADAVVKAKGDSMIGARIYDGDIVFIRYQEQVENGEIAAVIIESADTYDAEIVLKRFYRYDSIIVLRSENPNYKDMEYQGNDMNRVRVLGKAIAFQSELI